MECEHGLCKRACPVCLGKENDVLRPELEAANHDVKELTRCVADYKAENERQKKLIDAFLAYRNFIKALKGK